MPDDAALAATLPLTPCIGICRLDDRGYCIGCRRTDVEIGRWLMMSDAERRHIMHEILPARHRQAQGITAVMGTLQSALLPLSAPPTGPGWNHADMTALLGHTLRHPAAVLIGLRESAQPHLVLTLRTDQLQAHAGQVAFPGGRSDPGDADAVATALRESEEEIGLDPALVTPLGYLDCFETISGYCITPVVARIAAGARLRPAPDEVAEVFEVPLAFFLDPSNMRRYTMEFRGQRRPMVEFVHGRHRIWGATAAMLCNLLQRMGHA
ncbi:MAG: CoA pyrophosphatase [Xanthomonadaceae bacterium]|nr:CoA pyrophosphatase [Xanthomonadaceae bacterium]